MKKKLFVLLLAVVLLATLVTPMLAAGGNWHWGGRGSGGGNGNVCNLSCPNGRLDLIRCECVPPAPPGLD